MLVSRMPSALVLRGLPVAGAAFLKNLGLLFCRVLLLAPRMAIERFIFGVRFKSARAVHQGVSLTFPCGGCECVLYNAGGRSCSGMALGP